MVERLIAWLAAKANDYLIWVHEREIRDAAICPDCDQPEPVCYCAEKADRDAIMQSAYDAGREDGRSDCG